MNDSLARSSSTRGLEGQYPNGANPPKASLRARARQASRRHSPRRVRAAASAEICRRIQALPEWAAARPVALYAAQPSEPDLAPLLAGSRQDCSAFPSLRRRAGVPSLPFRGPSSSRPMEPPRAGPATIARSSPLRNRSDLCIPGLAFTRAGGRAWAAAAVFTTVSSSASIRARSSLASVFTRKSSPRCRWKSTTTRWTDGYGSGNISLRRVREPALTARRCSPACRGPRRFS